MLSDEEVEQATRQLAEYRQNDSLSTILDKYAVLLQDYQRLKSDYEEERDAREKYKQRARGQERNPFVLVLIDGDGYVFHDNLIGRGADGGCSAAQLLNDLVLASLQQKGIEHCQVMVRVYANVAGLSKALARTNLIGKEARSLSPFIASFNRSYGLTDFVDAGELKENADFKLRAMLRLYADNAQCKHIFFAACHDVGYISELMPHRGNSQRFTLIKAPGVRFHEQFKTLNLTIEELPGLFRTSALDDQAMYRSAHEGQNGTGKYDLPIMGGPQTTKASAKAYSPSLPSTQPPVVKEASSSRPICSFHKSGTCKFGKICKNQHVDTPTRTTVPTWRTNGSSSPTTSVASAPAIQQLPRKGDIPKGTVPVNDGGHRLDTYMPQPSNESTERLRMYLSNRRVCNNFQLGGTCVAGENCEYDHDPIDESLKPALTVLARSQPCARRGKCRVATCVAGHICQTIDCKIRGGKTHCKIPHTSHSQSLVVARYVPAIETTHQRTLSRTDTMGTGNDDSADEEEEEDGGVDMEVAGEVAPEEELLTFS